MSLLLALFACGGADLPEDRPEPGAPPATAPAAIPTLPAPAEGALEDGLETCDAGTEAWVQRTLPFVLGRRARGAAEVEMWTAVADTYGRDVVVRAMTHDPRYAISWRAVLGDLLLVSRRGSDNDDPCHQSPLLAVHDGTLADHISRNPANGVRYAGQFNMADVLVDSLVGDNLAAAWQANVFARTNYVPVCSNTTDPYQIETERRLALGDEFLDNYTNRSVTCMNCHNSEWSVTDAANPNDDHTWGVEGALFEKSLFDASTGPSDPDGFYSIFRYEGIVEDTYFLSQSGPYPVRPWGWSDTCGTFDDGPKNADYLGYETGYFLDPVDPSSSLFDIAESLRVGAESLAEGPLAIGDDGLVDPDQALAYLTAQHLVDRVWELATGSPLTVPYGFSRNRDQSAILQGLTNRFLTSGWSLRELLVAVTTDPVFNAGLPTTCGVPAYSMDPVLNPWSVEDPNRAISRNGPGDLVHRHYARVLVNSAHHALDWQPPTEYFVAVSSTDLDLATAIGVFLNRSEAGFSGTDLQGVLAWEGRFGTCNDPAFPNDFVSKAIDEAIVQGGTVEDVLLAIKDRLLADGAWDSDVERDLVEDLLEIPLDTPIVDVALTARRNIGLFCGALTVSPRFFLAVEPHAPGPIPAVLIDAEADCERLRLDLLTQGVSVTCNGWMPE